jgi:hypothetical protein
MVKKGERRYGPPPGYTSSTEAIKLLGKTFYKHVNDGRIRKITPTGHKHGFYNIEDIQTMLRTEATFKQAKQDEPISTDATFAVATPEDMDALYTMAVKLFPRTANAELRREWMRKEPQGHFIMRREADGAIVAYLYLLSFKDTNTLADYLHGNLPSRAISREHILTFVPGVPAHYVAIGGIGSDPDIEQELRSTYTALLIRGVRHELALWGERGIIIPHLYAFSETNQGIAMCVKLGMNYWEPPHGKWCTFALDTSTSRVAFLRGYQQGLAQWTSTYKPEPTQAPEKPRRARPQATQQEEGTINLTAMAQLLSISRSTLTDWLIKYNLPKIEIDNPARPGEKKRTFTQEQQTIIQAWHAEPVKRIFP